MSLNVSGNMQNIAFKAELSKSQKSAECEDCDKLKPAVSPNVTYPAIAVSTAAGAGIGAQFFSKPRYQNLDELMKSKDVYAVMQNVNEGSSQHAKRGRAIFENIFNLDNDARDLINNNLKDKKSFTAEEFKHICGYAEIPDDIENTKNIIESFKKVKGETITKPNLDYTVSEILSRCSDADFEKGVQITDDTLKGLTEDLNRYIKAQENVKKSIEDTLKAAGGSEISKEKVLEFIQGENKKIYLDTLGEKTKTNIYESLKEFIPKNRTRTGLIGAGAGLVLSAAALLTYAKCAQKN